MLPNVQTSQNTIGVFAIGGEINVQNIKAYGSTVDELHTEFTLPPLSSCFLGRNTELSKLFHLFFQQNKTKVAICGPVGFGKTETAKQFAHRCLATNKVKKVFWIYSDNINSNQQTLLKVYKHFKHKKCLFVFDNVKSRQEITNYEPPDEDNFLFLVTSSEEDWIEDITIVKINTLSTDAAIKVFKVILGTNYKEQHLNLYMELISLVKCVPLALNITAKCLLNHFEHFGTDYEPKTYVNYVRKCQDTKNAVTSYKNYIYNFILVNKTTVAALLLFAIWPLKLVLLKWT